MFVTGRRHRRTRKPFGYRVVELTRSMNSVEYPRRLRSFVLSRARRTDRRNYTTSGSSPRRSCRSGTYRGSSVGHRSGATASRAVLEAEDRTYPAFEIERSRVRPQPKLAGRGTRAASSRHRRAREVVRSPSGDHVAGDPVLPIDPSGHPRVEDCLLDPARERRRYRVRRRRTDRRGRSDAGGRQDRSKNHRSHLHLVSPVKRSIRYLRSTSGVAPS